VSRLRAIRAPRALSGSANADFDTDLTTVAEDSEVQLQQPEVEEDAEARGADDDNDRALLRQSQDSVGAFSTLSGTTALTTQSNLEAAGIDPDTVLTELKALHDASETVLETAAPNNITADSLATTLSAALNPATKTSKVLRLRSFEALFDEFTSHGYIRPDAVHKACFPSGTPPSNVPEYWTLKAILYKANMAKLLRDVLPAGRGSDSTWELLRGLDDSFPRQFWKSQRFDHDVFSIGLEVRTQLFIELLARSSSANDITPIEKLAQVFLETPPQDQKVYEDDELGNILHYDHVRGWDSETLQEGGESWQGIEEATRARAARLRQYVPSEESQAADPDAATDFEGLYREFGWEDFKARIIEWVSLRNVELTEDIAERKNVREIEHGLKEAMHRPTMGLGRSAKSIDGFLKPNTKAASKVKPGRRTRVQVGKKGKHS